MAKINIETTGFTFAGFQYSMIAEYSKGTSTAPTRISGFYHLDDQTVMSFDVTGFRDLPDALFLERQ